MIKGLKKWFIVHAVVDLIFGIPLLIMPIITLTLLGWKIIDPFASRLLGAVLVGIAVLSIACNKSNNIYAFKTALKFKSTWGSLAFLVAIYSALTTEITFAWIAAIIFLMFSIAWNYYRVNL